MVEGGNSPAKCGYRGSDGQKRLGSDQVDSPAVSDLTRDEE
jgi:hypothetical protein